MYAVIYKETYWVEGYGRGDLGSNATRDAVKTFENKQGLIDWVLANEHKQLGYQAYDIRPLKMKMEIDFE